MQTMNGWYRQPSRKRPGRIEIRNGKKDREREERQEQQHRRQPETSESLIDTSALGAVDIFSMLMEDDHTHEYIDPSFRYGRKKKKKKRRRRL